MEGQLLYQKPKPVKEVAAEVADEGVTEVAEEEEDMAEEGTVEEEEDMEVVEDIMEVRF